METASLFNFLINWELGQVIHSSSRPQAIKRVKINAQSILKCPGDQGTIIRGQHILNTIFPRGTRQHLHRANLSLSRFKKLNTVMILMCQFTFLSSLIIPTLLYPSSDPQTQTSRFLVSSPYAFNTIPKEVTSSTEDIPHACFKHWLCTAQSTSLWSPAINHHQSLLKEKSLNSLC